ncbi:YbaN family protein [Staphylococcus haemolyticus]|uniref:YbaN family protein n=1 Tax=Staphylococcus haemolyticus TaxID=1283 RepID=UPI001A9508E7|nr:YbaN family protein [Staphylococcus haemolyticus]QTK07519.1 YbaN family protein [Staphylococcus haemolyticus]QTK09687.1 YbaN family protein [Staphylococcus haemolyticus]QTK11873.1 YbaN family protein [Staphylococcus haemolyticus]
MRYVLIALGIVFTVIAFTGAVLPLLPTTPFLILAAICFTNSSRKFKIWLESTQIYKNYVENFKKYKGYTMKEKIRILISLYIVIVFSIFMISNLYIRIGLMIMVVIQTIVLFTFVKTLPANFNQEKDS